MLLADLIDFGLKATGGTEGGGWSCSARWPVVVWWESRRGRDGGRQRRLAAEDDGHHHPGSDEVAYLE